jgi:hypothetical protein
MVEADAVWVGAEDIVSAGFAQTTIFDWADCGNARRTRRIGGDRVVIQKGGLVSSWEGYMSKKDALEPWLSCAGIQH